MKFTSLFKPDYQRYEGLSPIRVLIRRDCPCCVVVIVPAGRPGTALVKKNHRLMGRDFKALLTGLAGYIIIHSDEVIS